MNHLNEICLLTALLCLCICAGIVWSCRRKTKKTLDTIDQMLTHATKGNFTEDAFDESRLSALETRFAHYLLASAVSAQNAAREKDRIKTLIADISHQTKTPISNLLLHSELLMEEDLPPDIADNVEIIHAQSRKLRFLIDALIKLSRLETGIITLSPRPGSIGPLMQDTAKQYADAARKKGLYLHLEETEITAVFDPKWTAEALCNIIDNAVKYTDHGGITISATAYELFVRIDITDSGIGISEEDHARIFSRFYRAEESRGQEGVGIGLYLAREIISGEGGYIKAAASPGGGSVFSVFLPCVPAS